MDRRFLLVSRFISFRFPFPFDAKWETNDTEEGKMEVSRFKAAITT
jgi:hypothetical protein